MSPVSFSLGTFVNVAARIAEDVDAQFCYVRKYNEVKMTDTCDYVREGEASCYVGKILAEIGVAIDEFSRYEGNGASVLLNGLRNNEVVNFAGDERNWTRLTNFATDLQGSQDDGITWKTSYIWASRNLV